nr:rutc family protein [Quercus suber]
MAPPEYFAYAGFGEYAQEHIHYSQAVRIGNNLVCSGQGGWHRQSTPITIPTDLGEEVDQAFDNVEHTIQHAGGKGWQQVYKINIYCKPLNSEIADHILRNFRKYMPDHKPVYTVIETPKLGLDAMRIEVEVSAYLGD